MDKHQLPQFNQLVEQALARLIQQYRGHLPPNLYDLAIAAVEKPLLRLILQEHEHNQSQAAKVLGINRATLRKKMQEYQLMDE